MSQPAQFPLNAWYAAAWRADIGQDLTARTVCEQPMVLFRRRDGGVSALEDVCKHRMLPLSMGRLENDAVVCGYHGMTFSPSGDCVKMPGARAFVPSKANGVRAYPVVERHNLVWVWPGDPDKADHAAIPDLHWADDPDWSCGPCYLHMACDFRLVIDNLMDLTHETYVHATSIGHPALQDALFELTTDQGQVWLKRFMIDVEAPPFLAAQLKWARDLPPDHVDRWQIIRFEAPTSIVIDVGVAPTGTGAPEGDYSKGVNTRVLNAITPGSAGETHYFFTLARNFLTDDVDLTETMRARNMEIFLEDKVVLEAQHRTMAGRPNQAPLNFAIDKGGVRARQAIDRMVAAERAGQHPSIEA